MSRSQSRCMMLILRHAWLNLLDKHMTTGRINQVAVVVLVHDSGRRRPPSPYRGFVTEKHRPPDSGVRQVE